MMSRSTCLKLASLVICAIAVKTLVAQQPRSVPPQNFESVQPTLPELLQRQPSQPAAVAGKSGSVTKGTPQAKLDVSPGGGGPKGVLTKESLLEMLTNLGYEPTVEGNNKDVYRVKISRASFRSNFTITLSGDAAELWFVCYVLHLGHPEDAPAPALLKLFEDQLNMRSAFNYDPSSKWLFLFCAIDNRDISPAILRKSVDAFDRSVETTYPHWNAQVLQPIRVVDSEAAKATRQKLQGTWKGVTHVLDGQSTDLSNRSVLITFTDKKLVLNVDGTTTSATLVFPENQGANAFDFAYDAGGLENGILKLEGNTLTLCTAGNKKPRPTSFTAEAGAGNTLLILKKQ